MNATANISSAPDRSVSEGLGLWEPKRTLTLEAARSHTRRIKLMRYVLIAISCVLVTFLILQFFSDRGGPSFENDPSESVKMTNPRYSGRTGDGLPFNLTADTAIRRMKNLNTVLLDSPVLEFMRSEGVENSSVIAKDGAYNDVEKILDLNKDVNLETDDGNKCDTTHARIFNVEKRITGNEPIYCTGDFGQVSGQRYEIKDDYSTFIFKDGLVAKLTRSAGAMDAEDSFGFGGSGPIDVTSDLGIYKGRHTDLRGDVRVAQEGAVITSDKMDIFRVNEGGEETGSVKLGAIQRIDAQGDFHYVTADNDIRGRKGVYERDKSLMTVTGDVIVVQPDGKRVEAQKMTYNTKTGTIRFLGNCLGRDCASNGRTEIRIPGSGK